MSHFSVFVFTKPNGKTVEELLAPYDEQLECAPYVKYTREQAIAKTRAEIERYKNTVYAKYLENKELYREEHSDNPTHLDYLEKEFPARLTWSDEDCFREAAQFYDEDMITPDGSLLSTYNPNSKWDWYVIGGRWNGELRTVDGQHVNVCYANEVDWKESCPFAFISPNGVWHEKGEMGWWGIVTNEKDKCSWDAEFEEFLASLSDDVEVTIVDCHI